MDKWRGKRQVFSADFCESSIRDDRVRDDFLEGIASRLAFQMNGADAG
jgi:hypothetical protein